MNLKLFMMSLLLIAVSLCFLPAKNFNIKYFEQYNFSEIENEVFDDEQVVCFGCDDARNPLQKNSNLHVQSTVQQSPFISIPLRPPNNLV